MQGAVVEFPGGDAAAAAFLVHDEVESEEFDEEVDAVAERLAGKIARLRIFENEEGKFDRSVVDVHGGALVVSQFTLIADTAKGNRPSFTEAAPPGQAERLYEGFCEALESHGLDVAKGRFGARMAVEIVNDGPATIVLDA